MTRRASRRWLRGLLASGYLFAASSCGGGASDPSTEQDSPTTTLRIAGAVEPASTLPLPSDPSPTVESSSGGTSTVPGAERLTIRSEVPLAAGSYRTTTLAGPSLALDIDLPDRGIVALDTEGAFFLTTDGSGEDVLLMVWHLDNGVAVEADADLVQFADREYARQVSSPIPDDALGWLAARPGVTTGPVESVDIGGLPARQQAFRFGPFDGAGPCSPGDPDLCHSLIWAPPTGVAFTAGIGDELLVSELEVGGQRLAVMQDLSSAPELAAGIAASLRLTHLPHPAAPIDALPLPFAGPLEASATYVDERSTGGIWLVPGVDDVATKAGYLRDRFVRFDSADSTCGSLADGTQGGWIAAEVGASGDSGGVEIPADIAGAITTASAIDVVAGPTAVDLGDAEGMVFDVRPVGIADVALTNTSHLIEAGATTRLVVAPRGDGGSDLAVVTLGTACEGLLDGLRFVPGAKR